MANPAPDFSVREATAADAPWIADLALELGYHVDVEDVHHRLAALPATHLVLVAGASDRVVGWLHAFHSQSLLHGDRMEIAGLAVADDYQGQGVGTMLITHLERWTHRRDIQAIRVLSGSERIAAHQFYRSRGYRQLKTEHVFTKVPPLG